MRVGRRTVSVAGMFVVASLLPGSLDPRPAFAFGCFDASTVAAGRWNSLTVQRSDGSVWASGDNSWGQLGIGTVNTTSGSLDPVRVGALTDAVSVAVGDYFSMAALADGTVWAWGDNSWGELGDGTHTNRASPVQASGLADIVAVAAGQGHALAVRTDGTVWGWGYNGYGQLGDGTLTNRSGPVQVSGLADVVAVAAGDRHSLAVRADGTVWGWGYNGYGQLGDGTTVDRTVPTQVGGLADVVAVAAGDRHSLAVRTSGSVWGWGGNAHGQLGDGTTVDRTTPVPVGGMSNVAGIAAGDTHSLARRWDGTVWAWGDNEEGQLGDGTNADRATPLPVVGLAGAVSIAAGRNLSRAVGARGTAWSWGTNSYGQIGDGTTRRRAVPGPANCSPTLAPAGVPSDDCDGVGQTNVVSGFVADTYLKLRTTPGGPTTTLVCVAAEHGDVHLGGVVRINGAAPGPPTGRDEDAASVAACARNAGNQRVQAGTVLGQQPYWIDVTPLPAGSDDAAWVCVRFTATLGFRLRFSSGGAGNGTSFLPDPAVPRVPAYTDDPWPTVGPSAACQAGGSGTVTRDVNIRVGSTPVALYRWAESPSRAHLCVRAGAVGGAGGRLALDSGASPGASPVLTSTDSIGPCPFDIITRAETPTYGIYISDPQELPDPPVSACVAITTFAVGISVGAEGPATASWHPDPT